MTNTSRSVRQAVHLALTACASAAAAPMAFAEAPADAGAKPEAVQEIVVTGSRIAQSPNEVSISPIQSVSSVDIQQSGLVRTEDILNNLPQVVAEQSAGFVLRCGGASRAFRIPPNGHVFFLGVNE